ncbi:hypothetical protein [Silvanigrella aquatica]|uniref:Uncharacterized protein n=1 Tax=Silvanigrella aquatica TaxID=1915309 RepID=A0A1L4CYL8_9BACT|nr:hypothetical protein [Silvanigrella aquatica]APJ03025.1 hypothetical protein AXG55_03480 [Silvanigrella aquatica]
MVFFQNLSNIKQRHFKNPQAAELRSTQGKPKEPQEQSIPISLSLVKLFYQFIKENCFPYGNIEIFKGYFEECSVKYQESLANNPLDTSHINLSDFILNSVENHSFKNREKIEEREILEKSYEIDSKHNGKMDFLNDLDIDFQKISLFKSFSYFYIIQDNSESKNTYGIYIYSRFGKTSLIFYNPLTKIEEFKENDIDRFKEDFKTIIQDYEDKFFTNRTKLEHGKNKSKNNIEKEDLLAIIYNSSKKYMEYIQNKKYRIIPIIIKEEYLFCKEIVDKIESRFETVVINSFFANFSKVIQKMRKTSDVFEEKSFWIFFLMHYLTYNDSLAQLKLSELNSFLEQDKNLNRYHIFDFVISYFNKKFHSPRIPSKNTICLILIEVYKQIASSKYRIPFYNEINPFQLNMKQNEIVKIFFNNFQHDDILTIVEWNSQNIVYNERFISKRFNGTYIPLIGLSFIGKTQIPPLVPENPTKNQLENHFLSATDSFDTNFRKFCLSFCNHKNVFSLGNYIQLEFNKMGSFIIDLKENKYIFIHKICPNVYDFMVVFNIQEIYENFKTKKLKNPIQLGYVFTLVIKNDEFFIKNFNIGYLNKTINDRFSEQMKLKIIEILIDEKIYNIIDIKKLNNKINYII